VDGRGICGEPVPVSLQQPGAMRGLLLTHAVEHSCRRRKIGADALGIVGVHAFVFLLEGDGEREDLALRKRFKLRVATVPPCGKLSPTSCLAEAASLRGAAGSLLVYRRVVCRIPMIPRITSVRGGQSG
jgi:hypothetical protein